MEVGIDNVKTMRLLLSAVQAGSLSGAGRKVGLSAASVSRQITALEDDLGVRLLNRTSRRLSLTDAGHTFFTGAQRVLQDIDELRDSVTQLAARPRGTLRVQCRVSLGTQYVAPRISNFLTQYPDLKIDLWLTDNDLDLTEHGIDLAIRAGDSADSTLVSRLLASSPRVICASPNYWAQHGKPASPQVLKEHNCLTYRYEFGKTATLWQFKNRANESTNIHVSGSFQTNNGEALRVAAAAGLGVALLPAWTIKEYLAAGTLERVFQDYEITVSDLDFGIYAVCPSRHNLSDKTRLFIEYLATEFSAQDWNPS